MKNCFCIGHENIRLKLSLLRCHRLLAVGHYQREQLALAILNGRLPVSMSLPSPATPRDFPF